VRQLAAKGGRTVTGSLTDDRGNRGNTIPAALCPTFDPAADYQFEDGSVGPLGEPIKDKSITATQELSSKPMFTPGAPPITLIAVTTVKDGKEVNIIHKTKVVSGVRPVKSLLGPKPTFNSGDNIKRKTSRSSEIVREKDETIDPTVVRLSWNRPDHLVKQAQQQGIIEDAELGIQIPEPPDDADLS
jgi:hypothetical protein